MFADFVAKMQPESDRGRLLLRISGIIVLILFILELPNAVKDTEFLPVGTLVLMAVYSLFALGLNIVVGFAGLLDLGYVAFFLFGAYTAAFLMSDFGYQVSARKGS